MGINYEKLMALDVAEREFSYGERETMLYALGIGFGADPMNRDELPFVYEKKLKVMPTQATVVAWDDGPALSTGLNFLQVVHGEQRISLKRPFPAAATILSKVRVAGAFDKGPGRGAILLMETTLREKQSGDVLAVMLSTIFARADGGFGGPAGGGPPPHTLPDRAPDRTLDLKTGADQALIYALSGDRNPLHRDPDVAAAAGFPKPILHGLCTYGHAIRAIVTTMLDHDPDGIREIEGRFSAPVYPGETIRTEMWRDGNVLSFRCYVTERNLLVINNGKVVVAA